MDEKPAVASEHDREHFRRLGEWERENHERALREHRSLPLDERLRRSWRFCREFAPYIRREAAQANPGEFYERARRLALYRS